MEDTVKPKLVYGVPVSVLPGMKAKAKEGSVKRVGTEVMGVPSSCARVPLSGREVIKT